GLAPSRTSPMHVGRPGLALSRAEELTGSVGETRVTTSSLVTSAKSPRPASAQRPPRGCVYSGRQQRGRMGFLQGLVRAPAPVRWRASVFAVGRRVCAAYAGDRPAAQDERV